MKPQPPVDLEIPFDRVTYREGQLLASRDLQDDFHANQRLRRLHTRYQHDTWGIALGFTLKAQANDDAVHIGPGYAIDDSAREMLLPDDVTLPVPNTESAVDLMLVINYRSDSAYKGLPDLARLCFGGLDPRGDRPVFAWRTPDTLRLGSDVPLAAFGVQAGALLFAPDLSVRRYAHRMIRPHIGFGTVETMLNVDGFYGTITVDTSDAGFGNTPQYFARLDLVDGDVSEDALRLATSFSYLEDATSTGFTYHVAFGAKFVQGEATVKLTWIGVEPIVGCEPSTAVGVVVLAEGFAVNQVSVAVPGGIS